MIEYPRRYLIFNENWNETSPTIEEFARAEFFNSDKNNAVTGFYCGGSITE
jgi:hypothetical protein